jgi:hypothetical protein
MDFLRKEAPMELRDVHDALARIRSEYTEMPEMRLTLPQLKRLLNVPMEACEIAVAALVESGFLAHAADGSFSRPALTM